MILEAFICMIAPVYLAFKMSRLYIPKDFEQTLAVRMQAALMITASLFVRTNKNLFHFKTFFKLFKILRVKHLNCSESTMKWWLLDVLLFPL